MEATWYILVTRHFEGDREEKELHIGQCGALECNSREHALENIGIIKKRPSQLAQGEHSEPTYEPIPASALDTIFPDRKKI
jgi:hypothetical protein